LIWDAEKQARKLEKERKEVGGLCKALDKLCIGGKKNGKGNDDKSDSLELFGWIDLLFGK
jgi:hypothetical protein